MSSAANSPAIVLVDGSSYLYRAFHALPALESSKHQPTGAIKGVISMIRRLQKDYPDSRLVVVFDAPGKTFRDDWYPEYKANRPPMPDELRSQIEPIHEIVRAMGLPLLMVEGVEADDVIGTLAKRVAESGQSVLVSTGDKDMAQLVNEQVCLINTMNDSYTDVAAVQNKYGFGPESFIDYLALMGDKVDNIPGVAGVGEKTAQALLSHFGSIEALYKRLDEVPELSIRGAKKLPEKLEKERENAELSYKLATIDCDLDLGVEVSDLNPAEANTEALRHWFTELEFQTWVDELGEGGAGEEPETEYEVITDEARWQDWLARLEASELFAFDTETTSLSYMEARVVGVSVAVEPNKAAYIPFGHDYLDAPDQLSEQQVLGALKALLENDAVLKVGQNLKYDRSVLANHDIHLKGIAHDTMLQSYVLESTGTRHDMDSLALKYLGRKTIHFEDIAGKGAKQLSFNQIALEEAGPYAAEDADITFQLHQSLWPKLSASEGQRWVYENIEMPLVPVLSDIERRGALVSAQQLGQQSIELAERLEALERQAHDLAGGPFNLSSPKQLGEILFDKLGLPVVKKTPKGAPSTAEEVLVELSHEYELPAIILQQRALAKLKSTYTDKLPKMIDPQSGRIHTSYHQAVTATGRLSSSDPNLQNIPIKSEEGRRIRKAFIAPPGHQLLAADYSQIELRIMAHLSGDKGLIQAFAEGRDIHSATAAEVFGVQLDAVSAEQRRSAKAINFGLIYGMSAFGLARQLHVKRGEAQSYIDLYFERYPGVADYMERTKEQAREQGYVETLFGRRLYLPEIKAANGQRRQAAERTAINAPMQGTAADIIKLAMLAVDKGLREEGLSARVVMQVHDELVLEVPDAEIDTLRQRIDGWMRNAAELSVPLDVGLGIGDNWDEAH